MIFTTSGEISPPKETKVGNSPMYLIYRATAELAEKRDTSQQGNNLRKVYMRCNIVSNIGGQLGVVGFPAFEVTTPGDFAADQKREILD